MSTDLGREIAALTESQARDRLQEVDHAVRRARKNKPKIDDSISGPEEEPEGEPDEDEAWREVLLTRLHQLTQDAFEHFVLYLLRSQGMELKRVGGTGDQGVDGIGTAPITNVLSTTVAVQAKRREPSKTVGREIVAEKRRSRKAPNNRLDRRREAH